MMGHLGETVDELEGAEEGAQAAGEDERRRGERGFDGLCLLCIRGGRGRRKNWDGKEHGRSKGRERGRATLERESSVPPFHARLRGKTHSSMSSIKLDFCALARFRSSLVNAFRVEGMHVDVQAVAAAISSERRSF